MACSYQRLELDPLLSPQMTSLQCNIFQKRNVETRAGEKKIRTQIAEMDDERGDKVVVRRSI